MRVKRTTCAGIALLLALTAGLACGDAGEAKDAPEPPSPPPASEPAPPAPTPTPEPVPVADAVPTDDDPAARGAELYATYCASCHGATGEGDGPVSAGLDPKPARHSDGEYMNALSDEYLHKVIAEGGAAVGKSPLMAPWGGTLSDAQIDDVVAHIRTLADPPYQGSPAPVPPFPDAP